MAALGYFVDMFDLLLIPIVRRRSLFDLGNPAGDAQVSVTAAHRPGPSAVGG